jgi:hypothetical protein
MQRVHTRHFLQDILRYRPIQENKFVREKIFLLLLFQALPVIFFEVCLKHFFLRSFWGERWGKCFIAVTLYQWREMEGNRIFVREMLSSKLQVGKIRKITGNEKNIVLRSAAGGDPACRGLLY